MELAQVTSRRATCLRRRVGCVLLSDRGHVLATGYNGVAAGLPHCNEVTGHELNPDLWVVPEDDTPAYFRVAEHWETSTIPVHGHACEAAGSPSGTNLDGCGAIHAEQNALLQCRDVHAIRAAFVTTAPCMTCTKLLLNTGCQVIVYGDDYPQAEAAMALWTKAGRAWRQYLEPLNQA